MDLAFTGILNLFVLFCAKLHDIPFILGYNLLDFLLAIATVTLVLNLLWIFLGIGAGGISTVSHGIGHGIKQGYQNRGRLSGRPYNMVLNRVNIHTDPQHNKTYGKAFINKQKRLGGK